MKKLKFLSILLVICLFAGIMTPCAHAIEDPPTLSSAAIYMADAETGFVYYERNKDARVYPASLTKMMTALLVIEAVERGELSLEDEVTAQEGYAYDMVEDGSSASILLGETLSLHDLVKCTMMASANEACNILAMYLCNGNISKFVDMMNARAVELGCTGTHFANPHGLPNDNHYTTAYDLFLIAQECMKHEIFAEIVCQGQDTVPATNLSGTRALINTNGLITSDGVYKGYYYEAATGIKTGYTDAAGYCLASAALKNQINPICIVMGGVMTESANGALDHSNYSDSIKLYNWVFSNYSRVELIKGDEIVTDRPVKLATDTDTIALRAEEAVTGVLPIDADLSLVETSVVIYDETIKAPLSDGQVLGEVHVSLGGIEYGSTYLVANRSVDLSYLSAMFDMLFSLLTNPIVLVVLLLGLVVLVVCGGSYMRKQMADQRMIRATESAAISRQLRQEQEAREQFVAAAQARSYQPQNHFKDPPAAYKTRDYFEEMFDDR